MGSVLWVLLLAILLWKTSVYGKPIATPTFRPSLRPGLSETVCLNVTSKGCSSCLTTGCTWCAQSSSKGAGFCYSGSPSDLPDSKFGSCTGASVSGSGSASTIDQICSDRFLQNAGTLITIISVIIPLCCCCFCGLGAYFIWKRMQARQHGLGLAAQGYPPPSFYPAAPHYPSSAPQPPGYGVAQPYNPGHVQEGQPVFGQPVFASTVHVVDQVPNPLPASTDAHNKY